MYFQFQVASNVDDYLKAIEGSSEFIIKRDVQNGIIVINYVFTCPTSFPDPVWLTGDEYRNAVLRRDCRGIKFDLETGEVVAKPFHKFFNVNEKLETQIGAIDWTEPHIILEKLDGSMITPFRHKDGSFQWHTKMGPTMVANPIHNSVGDVHKQLCEAMWEDSRTAIFEWCSRQQRIVIDYPEDRLVLTAVRHNVTGEYMSYPKLLELGTRFNVPVVKALSGSIENIHTFLDDTGDLKDAEGFVIRFDSGHMVKCKGLWYLRIHNTKEMFVFEKNVWNLILNDGVDDAKPFMDDNDRKLIEDFSTEFEQRLLRKANKLAAFVEASREKVGNDKKRFAMEIIPNAPRREQTLLYRIWADQNPIVVLKEYLLKNVGTQADVDNVRDLLDGLDWKDFYRSK